MSGKIGDGGGAGWAKSTASFVPPASELLLDVSPSSLQFGYGQYNINS